MRIHTDKLERLDIVVAVGSVGGLVRAHNIVQHGSRSRTRAFEFNLSGSGSQGGQWGSYPHKAATWDEWGLVIAKLFELDNGAHWGRVYEDYDHFHWSTGQRYLPERGMDVYDQHLRHQWEPQGRAATGSYYVAHCECGAVRRWMAPGRKWSEIADSGS